jgi:hypothetical protein
MIGTTDDFFRFIVGGLLRGDYNGKSVCSPCLVKLIRERLRTNYSTLKIERALGAAFKSPSALKRMPSFVCDQCGKTAACLGMDSR